MELCMEHVTKRIQGAVVLDRVSLRMKSGQIYGLFGRNGSGKTMLMRAVCGLIRPDAGRIRIDGAEQWKDFSYPADLGMLIENPSFLPDFTGYENLAMLASIRRKIGREEIRETLRRVGLDPADTRKVRKYSLGMRQRLGIACAVMERPGLLVLDEPFNGLDVDGYRRMQEIIREEKRRGALILLACHDREEMENLSDVIYKVEQGQVTLYGREQEGT